MSFVIEIPPVEEDTHQMHSPLPISHLLLRQPPNRRPRLRFTYRIGNVLDAPQDALIVHATNCLGIWGAGIAHELKSNFPSSFNEYQTLCNGAARDELVGTCVVSPFVQKETARYDRFWLPTPNSDTRHRRIVNLFTSIGYGEPEYCGSDNPGRSSKEDILRYTRSAVRALLDWLTVQFSDECIDFYRESTHNLPTEVWMCKFNSGRFQVPWKETEAILRKEFEPWEHCDRMNLVVVEHLSGEPAKGRKGTKKEVAGVNDQVVGAGLLGVDSSPPFVSQVVLANVGVLLAETLCALVTVYLNRCLVSMQR